MDNNKTEVNAGYRYGHMLQTMLAALVMGVALQVSAQETEPATVTPPSPAPATSPTMVSAVTPPAAAIAAVPESGSTMRLPELKAGEWFDGKAGGTFGEKTVNFLPRSKRVAIVGFKVVFVNETFSRARVRASYCRDATPRAQVRRCRST